VVEPASEIYAVADEIKKEQDLIWRPADDESAADHQRSDRSVASGLVYHRRACGIHLKQEIKRTISVWRSDNGVTVTVGRIYVVLRCGLS